MFHKSLCLQTTFKSDRINVLRDVLPRDRDVKKRLETKTTSLAADKMKDAKTSKHIPLGLSDLIFYTLQT